MTATKDFTWDQGADLTIKLIYKEGATTADALPVDLSVNYALRMDLVVPATKERVFTFNSVDIVDIADTDREATLSSGAGGTPNINIVIPRSLTLDGGEVFLRMQPPTKILQYDYDMFLRNTASDSQTKILTGKITIQESNTLWL